MTRRTRPPRQNETNPNPNPWPAGVSPTPHQPTTTATKRSRQPPNKTTSHDVRVTLTNENGQPGETVIPSESDSRRTPPRIGSYTDTPDFPPPPPLDFPPTTPRFSPPTTPRFPPHDPSIFPPTTPRFSPLPPLDFPPTTPRFPPPRPLDFPPHDPSIFPPRPLDFPPHTLCFPPLRAWFSPPDTPDFPPTSPCADPAQTLRQPRATRCQTPTRPPPGVSPSESSTPRSSSRSPASRRSVLDFQTNPSPRAQADPTPLFTHFSPCFSTEHPPLPPHHPLAQTLRQPRADLRQTLPVVNPPTAKTGRFRFDLAIVRGGGYVHGCPLMDREATQIRTQDWTQGAASATRHYVRNPEDA